MSEWISVEDRLPEVDKEILFCVEFKGGHKIVLQGYFSNIFWRTLFDGPKYKSLDKYHKVTHWTKAIQPPKD